MYETTERDDCRSSCPTLHVIARKCTHRSAFSECCRESRRRQGTPPYGASVLSRPFHNNDGQLAGRSGHRSSFVIARSRVTRQSVPIPTAKTPPGGSFPVGSDAHIAPLSVSAAVNRGGVRGCLPTALLSSPGPFITMTGSWLAAVVTDLPLSLRGAG